MVDQLYLEATIWDLACSHYRKVAFACQYVADHQGQHAADSKAQDCYRIAEDKRTEAGHLAASACNPPAFWRLDLHGQTVKRAMQLVSPGHMLAPPALTALLGNHRVPA
jgi:hypothetical protein